MKILLMSDNHSQVAKMYDLIDQYKGKVDYILHAGDSELKVSDDLWKDFDGVVAGNMDFFEPYKDELTLSTSEGIIYLFHGHRHNVKFDLRTAQIRGEEVGASMVLFGHTHCLLAEVHDGVLFVNPGSLSFPRCGNPEKTYAIIEVTKDHFKVDFYDDKDVHLTKYSKVFDR